MKQQVDEGAERRGGRGRDDPRRREQHHDRESAVLGHKPGHADLDGASDLSTFTALLGAVAAIPLLVGGIGVMDVLLVT
jgi:hypothetical protein